MMVNFEIRGVDAVNVRMKTIANDMRKKFAMQAMAKAARIVTNAAKANADRIDDAETGRKISKNIQQRFASRTYRATGDVMYRIGVASPKGRIPKDNPDEGLGGPTPHWHLIELGTPKARAEPFLLPALATNVDKVTDTFVSELTKRLDKAGA